MLCLVRYGEIGVKSAYVQRQLRDRLASNLHEQLRARGARGSVRAERGRLYVEGDPPAAVVDALRHTFGVVSFSPAVRCASDLDAIVAAAVEVARSRMAPPRSFAIRPRRAGKHPFTSSDVARAAGKAVLAAIPGTRVDLNRPDVEVVIEVRGDATYVATEVEEGPGGLPLGSQGTAAAWVADENDAAAAWLLMKRGCKVLVAGRGEETAELLRPWDPHLKTAAVERPSELGSWARAQGLSAIVTATSLSREPDMLTLSPLVGWTEEEMKTLLAYVRDPQKKRPMKRPTP